MTKVTSRSPFMLDGRNALRARAKDFAAKVQSAFPSVRAVYLRGSVLRAPRIELIRDVDIVAVIDREGQERCARIDAIAADLWSPAGNQPRCDFGLVGFDRLIKEPFFTVIQLILAFRSALLAGEAVWKSIPVVRADAALARRLQANHRKSDERYLERAHAAPANYGTALLVSSMQKKALRLGGILAMGVSQRFSRHPLRCATLLRKSIQNYATLPKRLRTSTSSGKQMRSHGDWLDNFSLRCQSSETRWLKLR